jgi:hypothetical protein
MISRRTILILAIAAILLIVPITFRKGYIKAYVDEPRKMQQEAIPANDEAIFDMTTAENFAMFPWMRYCLGLGVLMCVAGAASHGQDRRKRNLV